MVNRKGSRGMLEFVISYRKTSLSTRQSEEPCASMKMAGQIYACISGCNGNLMLPGRRTKSVTSKNLQRWICRGETNFARNYLIENSAQWPSEGSSHSYRAVFQSVA